MSSIFVLNSEGDVRVRGDVFVNANLSLGGNFIIGVDNNDANATSSFILGDNNEFSGLNQILINGNNNNILVGPTTVFGDFNQVESSLLVCGMNNIIGIGCEDSIVCGTNHLTNSSRYIGVFGDLIEKTFSNLGFTKGQNININNSIMNNAFGKSIDINNSSDTHNFGQNIEIAGGERNITFGSNIKYVDNRSRTIVLAPNGCNIGSLYETPGFPGLVQPPVSGSLTAVAKNGIYIDNDNVFESSIIKYNSNIDPIVDLTLDKMPATKAYVDFKFPIIPGQPLYVEVPTEFNTIHDALVAGNKNIVVVSDVTETVPTDLSVLPITQANVIVLANVNVNYEFSFGPPPGNYVYFDIGVFSLSFQGQGTINVNTSPINIGQFYFTDGLKFLRIQELTFNYQNLSASASSGFSLIKDTQIRFFNCFFNIKNRLQNFNIPFLQGIGSGSYIESVDINVSDIRMGDANHDYPLFDITNDNVFIYNIKLRGTVDNIATFNPFQIIRSSGQDVIINTVIAVLEGTNAPNNINCEIQCTGKSIITNVVPGNDTTFINLILQANDSVVSECTFGTNDPTIEAIIGGSDCQIRDNIFKYPGSSIKPDVFSAPILDSNYITNTFAGGNLDLSNINYTRLTVSANQITGGSIICSTGVETFLRCEFSHNVCDSFNFSAGSYTLSQFLCNIINNGTMNINSTNTSSILTINNNIIDSSLIGDLNIGVGGEINTTIINGNLVKNSINIYIDATNNVIVTSNKYGTALSFLGTSPAPTELANNI